MTPRRFQPPWLQHSANRTASNRIGFDGLLRAARRYTDPEAVRVLGAFLAVAAVSVLACWRGCGCSVNSARRFPPPRPSMTRT
jgi:hypothetical protein